MLTSFIKQTIPLALVPKRNRLGDRYIGYNRPLLREDEKVTSETADKWLSEDTEKARKACAKYGFGDNEPVVFTLFYIGHRRYREFEPFLKMMKNGERTKAALLLTNSRWLRNNPALASTLGAKIVRGEKTL